jgi:dipeptidyl aminopeptidase/acylaminoacyl peptidase
MRVPVGQAIALYRALHRAGAPATLRVYEDAHHWLTRPADVEDWHAAVLAFLEEHLGTDQA